MNLSFSKNPRGLDHRTQVRVERSRPSDQIFIRREDDDIIIGMTDPYGSLEWHLSEADAKELLKGLQEAV